MRIATSVVAVAAVCYFFGHLEVLLAVAEPPTTAVGRRTAVVVLGYRLEWPEGRPVRAHQREDPATS